MKLKNIVRVIIFILALSTMTYSGSQLFSIYSEYKVGDEVYEDFADQFLYIEEKDKKSDKNSIYKPDNSSHDAKDRMNDDDININIDFDSLEATNKDVVGWIYSENSPINYPIVQSGDNDYYLRKMIDGSYNNAGSIFMDFRNNRDFTDLNTIIYGHNMKNGSMFGTLDKYKSQEYYEEHPVIYLITPEQTYKIELFAGIVTHDSSNVYHIPQKHEDLKTLYNELINKSTFTSSVSLDERDRIITLSTCSYETDEARYVVIGKISDTRGQDTDGTVLTKNIK